MEEYYADGPLTPAEFEQDQKLYSQETPFIDRIVYAMQRFEQTRRLTPERRDIFYKWLHYGGVVVSDRAGQGSIDAEDMDKEDIAAALSKISVSDELRDDLETTDSEEPLYAVDFLGCTRSFLSRPAPLIYALDNKAAVELITTTIERFLDYLLQHNVCPEYEADICATRNFCREASHEMWCCAEAQRWLPGEFNIACSTLFGGSYSGTLELATTWDNVPEDKSSTFIGLSTEEALDILRFGVAGAGTQEVYMKYAQMMEEGQEIVVDRVIKDQGFEIVNITNPSADCKDLYKNNSQKYRPVGRVIAKSWTNPVAPPEDLTIEEKQNQKPRKESSDEYVFFVEEIILQNLSVGQRIEAAILELNCGIYFFDSFLRIYADFDLWLMNEMVEDYRYPRWLPGAYAPGAPGWMADEHADVRAIEGDMSETYEEIERDHVNGIDSVIANGIENMRLTA